VSPHCSTSDWSWSVTTRAWPATNCDLDTMSGWAPSQRAIYRPVVERCELEWSEHGAERLELLLWLFSFCSSFNFSRYYIVFTLRQEWVVHKARWGNWNGQHTVTWHLGFRFKKGPGSQNVTYVITDLSAWMLTFRSAASDNVDFPAASW
jgi:hypothetical protein